MGRGQCAPVRRRPASRAGRFRGMSEQRRPGVARNIAKTPVRVAWATALCSVALGVTLWTASGGAQLPEQAPPMRARDALKAAHEYYKRGDYDAAARYFEHARMKQGELSATDRQDLGKLMQQNAVAMHARRD